MRLKERMSIEEKRDGTKKATSTSKTMKIMASKKNFM